MHQPPQSSIEDVHIDPNAVTEIVAPRDSAQKCNTSTAYVFLSKSSTKSVEPTAGAAFGSTSAFGQPQQPQANPMSGNLANSTPGTSAFGTFGQNSPQQAASTSAFGAPKPATGFGLFGGSTNTASGFGSGGGTFGSTTRTGTSGREFFGSNTNAGAGNPFGTFGDNRITAGFGATSQTAGNDPDASVQPVTTGTSNPPYSPFSENDQSSNFILQYQTITAMPAYRGTSLEVRIIK
ncbi:hypothetical protein AZE42_09937 [Rhizopogon vesiculosus]|uniref:Uncharacterized protein n=1 Tax=Rhizopogon vesiculosus TaxID=180088 RepID=A0A1J8PLG6_9AGAM|nr:hypothetical protein AZE42_09937 [Rhizopogon vesiculosus]